MKITIKYDRKDFFGNRVYTEDYIICGSTETALKALQKALKKVLDGTSSTMQVTDYDGSDLVIWQEYSDIDSDILTVRQYETYNSYDDKKMSKQAVNKMLKKIAQIEKAA